jgi:hypothetical protein
LLLSLGLPRTGVVTGFAGLRTVGTFTGAVGAFTGAVGARTGAVGTATGALSVNAAVLTRTFGEPCEFCTTPIAPSATIASLTCCGVIDGLRSRYNAATPVTNGVAILVPDSDFEAVVLLNHALVIALPGLYLIEIGREI